MNDKMAQRVAQRFADFRLEAMSNLRSRTTGVDGVVIWVSAGEFAGADLQHGPRIKVVLGDKITTESLRNSVSVRISIPPEVLGELPGRVEKRVIQFVNKNREVLLRHWNGELDSAEMLEQLESL